MYFSESSILAPQKDGPCNTTLFVLAYINYIILLHHSELCHMMLYYITVIKVCPILLYHVTSIILYCITLYQIVLYRFI